MTAFRFIIEDRIGLQVASTDLEGGVVYTGTAQGERVGVCIACILVGGCEAANDCTDRKISSPGVIGEC